MLRSIVRGAPCVRTWHPSIQRFANGVHQAINSMAQAQHYQHQLVASATSICRRRRADDVGYRLFSTQTGTYLPLNMNHSSFSNEWMVWYVMIWYGMVWMDVNCQHHHQRHR
jgi:hypothetical protein